MAKDQQIGLLKIKNSMVLAHGLDHHDRCHRLKIARLRHAVIKQTCKINTESKPDHPSLYVYMLFQATAEIRSMSWPPEIHKIQALSLSLSVSVSLLSRFSPSLCLCSRFSLSLSILSSPLLFSSLLFFSLFSLSPFLFSSLSLSLAFSLHLPPSRCQSPVSAPAYPQAWLSLISPLDVIVGPVIRPSVIVPMRS